MRVWIDLTNSPHVLVMRPVIENLHARGHEVEVTARDFAQTLGLVRSLRDRPHRDRHAPRRRSGGQGARLWPTARGRCPGGRAARALRPRARARLQRRHGRGGAAADPERDDVRLRMGDGPTPGQLPAGPQRGRPRRDPAPAAGALRRLGQDPRLRRAQGGVLPGGLRARSGRARRAGAGPLRAARGRPDPARGVAVPPVRERPVRRRAGALARLPGGRAGAHQRAAVTAARGRRADRPRARDRRPVADRLRGPGGVGRAAR